MKKINRALLKKIEEKLQLEARPLEIEYFNYLFKSTGDKEYIKELKTFQNDDGGFGNAIEADLRMPDSSSMSTSVGLRYLLKLESSEEVNKMINKAVKYLEETYNEKRIGWYSVDKTVNEHPHSPWWHWDSEKEMTAIDAHWGNASAELLGYLTISQSKLSLKDLKEKAVDNIKSIENFDSFHELYCYCFMLEASNSFNDLIEKVSEGVLTVVEEDPEKWYKSYSPVPLNFINDKNYLYGLTMEVVNENLDLLVDRLNLEGLLTPHWDWDNTLYQGDMFNARNEWKGILTLEALEKLLVFDRIEDN